MVGRLLAVFNDGTIKETSVNSYQRWAFRVPTPYGYRYGWASSGWQALEKTRGELDVEVVECIEIAPDRSAPVDRM